MQARDAQAQCLASVEGAPKMKGGGVSRAPTYTTNTSREHCGWCVSFLQGEQKKEACGQVRNGRVFKTSDRWGRALRARSAQVAGFS